MELLVFPFVGLISSKAEGVSHRHRLEVHTPPSISSFSNIRIHFSSNISVLSGTHSDVPKHNTQVHTQVLTQGLMSPVATGSFPSQQNLSCTVASLDVVSWTYGHLDSQAFSQSLALRSCSSQMYDRIKNQTKNYARVKGQEMIQ